MHSPLQTQQPEQRCWPMTSTVSEIEEVLPDEDSDRTTLLNGEPLRRRVSGKSPVDEGPRRIFRQQSFGRDIGHAAAETYLITGLSFKLLRYLGVGYRWMTKLLALTCYAMLLMPGFLQVAYSYFFSKQVRRSIVYGDQPRNRLDLYLPSNNDGLKPVVVFVTGGAWIIGWVAHQIYSILFCIMLKFVCFTISRVPLIEVFPFTVLLLMFELQKEKSKDHDGLCILISLTHSSFIFLY